MLPTNFTVNANNNVECSCNVGTCSPTFQYNLSVPSSRIKQYKKNRRLFVGLLETNDVRSAETLVRNYQHTLFNVPEERRAVVSVSSVTT